MCMTSQPTLYVNRVVRGLFHSQQAVVLVNFNVELRRSAECGRLGLTPAAYLVKRFYLYFIQEKRKLLTR